MSTLRSPTAVSAPPTCTPSARAGVLYVLPPCDTPICAPADVVFQTPYPVVVGHEIIGKAVRVGKDVKHVKVGDRVGVGAQSGSCQNQKGDCEACADG